MNEDLLELIYTKMGFSDKGIDFEEFKSDMDSPEMQELIFERGGFEDRGITIDEFRSDLGAQQSEEPVAAQPEEKRERNPFVTFWRKAKAMSQELFPRMGVGLKTQRTRYIVGINEDSEFVQQNPDLQAVIADQKKRQADALRRGQKIAKKAEARRKGLTNSLRDIDLSDGFQAHDVLDGLNLVAGFIGEAIPQMAAGLTGIGGWAQMTEEVYSSAVQTKAEVTGKTVEEVIEEGLDNDAVLGAAAFASAAFEFAGAKGVAKEVVDEVIRDAIKKQVVKEVTSESVKRGMRNKVLGTARRLVTPNRADLGEAGTELAQTLITELAAGYEAGEISADPLDLADAAVGGFFGGAGIRLSGKAIGAMNRKSKQRLAELSQSKQRLQSDLAKLSSTSTAKETVENDLVDTIAEETKIKEDSRAAYENLSDDQRALADQLIGEIEQIDQALANEDLSEETRTKLIQTRDQAQQDLDKVLDNGLQQTQEEGGQSETQNIPQGRESEVPLAPILKPDSFVFEPADRLDLTKPVDITDIRTGELVQVTGNLSKFQTEIQEQLDKLKALERCL